MNQVITIRHISEVENSYACMYFHVCFMNHVYLTTYDKIKYILKNPNLIILCYGTLFLLQALCFHLKKFQLNIICTGNKYLHTGTHIHKGN